MSYILLPIIDFENVKLDDITKSKFQQILSHSLCRCDVNKFKLSKIILGHGIISVGTFNYVDNSLSLHVPDDLTYDEASELWSYAVKRSFYNLVCETAKMNLSNNEMIFVLCHEMSHYKNNDVMFSNSLMVIIYGMTTNPLFSLLMLLTLGFYGVLGTILFNHLCSIRLRFIEKRADLSANMNKNGKTFFEKIKDLEFKEKSVIHGSIMTVYDWYGTLFCGRTHPTNTERIEYLSSDNK
jgi:hypothetical protein